MKIQKLSPEVVGQIAAGEVVERPAAAIKELVENSVDAGATAITVDIREGGLQSIRVVDNGSGIPSGELRMAFERHATSKLIRAEDLHRVSSLGFRGEALASIAAVARVTLLSRQRAEDSGTQIVNEGGEITDIRPAACAEGTAITVRELFYNAPVRRRFMKKPSAEAALVADLMQKLILSHPDISFRLSVDGKPVYFSPGDGKAETALMSVFGLQALRQMHRVEGTQQGLVLSGFVGVGEASRGNRSQQHFFINGRAMRSPVLSQALEETCRQRVMVGRFPSCVLYLTLPYEMVDVNVHPNKWEVRFQDERAVSEALRDIVLEALTPRGDHLDRPALFPAPQTEPGSPATISRFEPEERLVSPAPVPPPSFPQGMALRSPAWERAERVEPEPAEQLHAGEQLPELQLRPVRLIGTVFDTYILYESLDKLCLCDQHAMHERLLFDRLMEAYSQGAVAQTLMLPQAISLSYRAYGSFLEHQANLAAAGFDAEDFGDQTVKLHTVPLFMGAPQAEEAFLEALEDLGQLGRIGDDKQVERIMQAACKHAVKGGERLPRAALEGLLREVLEGKTTPTCPHGRPLMVELSQRDLEKRFQRIPGG